MPRVTIKTGFRDAEGREENLTEYVGDVPGCPNIATRLLGCLVELRAMAADHVPGDIRCLSRTRSCITFTTSSASSRSSSLFRPN